MCELFFYKKIATNVSVSDGRNTSSISNFAGSTVCWHNFRCFFLLLRCWTVSYIEIHRCWLTSPLLTPISALSSLALLKLPFSKIPVSYLCRRVNAIEIQKTVRNKRQLQLSLLCLHSLCSESSLPRFLHVRGASIAASMYHIESSIQVCSTEWSVSVSHTVLKSVCKAVLRL